MNMNNIRHLFISLVAFGCFAQLTFAGNEAVQVFKIDPVHSGVSFKIRHIINQMPGEFTTFAGEIHFNASEPEKSRVSATIDVTSVNTRDKDRDSHLLNEDFFNAVAHPSITFISTKWVKTGENKFSVSGDLAMAGVSRTVTLDVELLGMMEARGVYRSGWTATTTLDRTLWGLTYGKPAIGTEVQVELNIQGHLQK